MSDIVFTVAGSNNASASNLPTGINGRYNSYTGLFTISGIPTASGSTYTVTATSANGCTSATANGTITVTNDNVVYLDNKLITRKELIAKVRMLHSDNPELEVILFSDRLVRFKNIVSILDDLNEIGIKNLNIAAKTEQ